MRILLFTFLLFIICSYGRESEKNSGNADSVLEIDLLSKPEATMTKLSEFAADIEYIPLQTTENSFLGNIRRKVISTDDKIYIQNLDEILCFDTYGKFLSKLQNRGRGPEEYTTITDFDISSDNKFLTLLSSSSSKLLIYEISDTGFIFKRSKPLQEPVPWRVRMVPDTDKAFLAIPPWNGTEPTLSLLINILGDTINLRKLPGNLYFILAQFFGRRSI